MPRNGVAYLAHVALLNDCVRKPSILPVLTGERETTSRAGITGWRRERVAAIFEAECRTSRQMQFANAFCRYIASENL